MQRRRSRYLDIYKGVGIILVVLGHMEMTPWFLKLWLNAFHMPLFFVAAGLLVGEGKLYERGVRQAITGRARSIMAPYFWFSLCAVLWDVIKALLAPDHPWAAALAGLWDSLSLFGVSVLWFLPVFFVGVTGYQLLRKKLPYPLALPSLAALALLLCIFRGFPGSLAVRDMSPQVFVLKLACVLLRGGVGMFFCAVGEGLGILASHMDTGNRRWVLLLLGAFATGIGSVLALLNARVSAVMVSFCYLLVGSPALFLASAICLAGGVLLLCHQLGKCAPLEYLGRYSMIIMVTHLDFRVIYMASRAGELAAALTGSPLPGGIAGCVVFAALELFWIWLFSGYMGFMMGKSGRKGKETLNFTAK